MEKCSPPCLKSKIFLQQETHEGTHNCNCEKLIKVNEKIQRKLNAKSVNTELLKGMDDSACCAEGGIQFTLRPFAFYLASRQHGKTYSMLVFTSPNNFLKASNK